MMKRYSIKNQNGRTDYIDVLKEIEDGYLIRLTRRNDGNEKISEETISRHLFNICLQTGYLCETEREVSSVA